MEKSPANSIELNAVPAVKSFCVAVCVVPAKTRSSPAAGITCWFESSLQLSLFAQSGVSTLACPVAYRQELPLFEGFAGQNPPFVRLDPLLFPAAKPQRR